MGILPAALQKIILGNGNKVVKQRRRKQLYGIQIKLTRFFRENANKWRDSRSPILLTFVPVLCELLDVKDCHKNVVYPHVLSFKRLGPCGLLRRNTRKVT